MRRAPGMIAALAVVVALGAGASASADPLVPGYGRVAPVESPGMAPDPSVDYKVVLSATKAGPGDSPSMALDHAARLANILDAFHVPPEHRHIVVVIHGMATPSVLNPDGLKAHDLKDNPNAELISRLIAAGVQVHVCGQALAAFKITRDQMLAGIQVDESALTTLAGLQLKGYALIPD
ncbi:MAG: DsrE family protein [Alphaproteobacteria bacterium]|nr:DsrE family protein [Alphaproteobacteria bacterium]